MKTDMPAATTTSTTSRISTGLRMDEWPRRLQVLRADRVRRPIGERGQRSGRVVAGVLREVARARHEQVWNVPALAESIDGAGSRVGSHHRAAAEMGRLVLRDVIGARAVFRMDLLRPHRPEDLGKLVRQEAVLL